MSFPDENVTFVQSNKFLSFSEFICGLAACEPQTPHGDAPGEARCRYIFRFYDKVWYYNMNKKGIVFKNMTAFLELIITFNCISFSQNSDGLLEYEEFLEMIKDIRKAKGLSISDIDVQKEASMSAK